MSISNQDALVTVGKDRAADLDIDRLDPVEAADEKDASGNGNNKAGLNVIKCLNKFIEKEQMSADSILGAKCI
jgi:hypothetical protein